MALISPLRLTFIQISIKTDVVDQSNRSWGWFNLLKGKIFVIENDTTKGLIFLE